MGDTQRRRLEERLFRELLLALALLGVAIVQVGMPPQPLAFFPNTMLLLVICRALLSGLWSAARWAFYGGIGLDICAAAPLGSHALALLLGALAALALLAPLHRSSWLLPLIGVPLGGLAYHAVGGLAIHLLVAPIDLRAYALLVALPELLATLIPALPAFLLLRWLSDRRRGAVYVDVY